MSQPPCFRDRRALVGLLANPEVHFGDAFADGRIGVDGDLVGALDAAYHALGNEPVRVLDRLRASRQETVARARRDIHHHYDLNTELYRQWLDRDLVYSCAYFDSPASTLDDAQKAKMQHICRKLGLRRGETVIDGGSGWGSLVLHMARHWGVRAIGYSVSSEQIRYARARAEREGLEDRAQFVETDYRQIDRRCDALVSVGMLEHVGRRSLKDFGRMIARCLDPDHGRGLLHFIGRDRPVPVNAWIEKRIFPGGYMPALSEVVGAPLALAGQTLVDVENLRFHYERAVSDGRVSFDERLRRAWRLYLAGSEAAFRAGSLQLFQVTFASARGPRLPWTRDALYEDGPGLPWNEPRQLATDAMSR